MFFIFKRYGAMTLRKIIIVYFSTNTIFHLANVEINQVS